MKKILALLLTVLLAFSFVGCDNKDSTPTDPSHTHNYSNTYFKNNTTHWQQCSCGNKINVEEHDYNAGVVTLQPTETKKGIKTYTCYSCGREKTEELPIKEPANNNNGSDNTTEPPIENSTTNFQVIYDLIQEKDNVLVIGSLMNEDICISTLNDKIIVSVSASQSTRYGVNPHEHNDTSIDFNVEIDKNGNGIGTCILIYKEIRVVNHRTQTTMYKKSTAVFDAKITSLGDAVDYRDYKIYYNSEKSYTQSQSGSISYYDDYLTLCKEHYAEGILQLALESFYILINE